MSHIHFRAPSNASGRRSSRASDALPKFYAEKPYYHSSTRSSPWIIPFHIVIPGARRRLRLWTPNIRGLHRASLTKFGKKSGSFLIVLVYALLIFSVFALSHRFVSKEKTWPGVPSTTLVFDKEDLERIWRWEIASGHHPSTRLGKPYNVPLNSITNPSTVPYQYNLETQPKNPSLPHEGSARVYLDVQSRVPNVAYPPRPKAGSAADLDVIMHHCDFATNSVRVDIVLLLKLRSPLT